MQGGYAANTLSHIGVGLNPGGIQVLVRESDAAEATEILSDRAAAVDGDSDKHAAPGKPHKTPILSYFRPPRPHTRENLAIRAFLTMLFSVAFFGPLILLAAYYWVWALIADRKTPIERPGRFRVHLIATGLVLMLLFSAVLTSEIPFYWSLLQSFLSSVVGP